MIIDILLAVVFLIYYYWLFSATGLVFLAVFRIRVFNFHFATLIGIFLYFSLINIFLLPLQFINTASFLVLIYTLISINILYLVFLLIFIRYWLNFHFIHKVHIYFLIIIIVFCFLFYIQQIFIKPNNSTINNFIINYFDHNNIKKNTLPISSQNNLNDGLGWYLNIAMLVVITKISPQFIVYNITTLYDSIFFASLFLTLTSTLLPRNYNIFYGGLSLITLFCSKLLLYFLGFQSYNSDNFIVNLFLAIFVIFSIFINDKFRSQSLPWIFGIMFTSYAFFSWDASYNIFFIIYILVWLILFHYKQNFLHDAVKIALFPSVVFIFYNIKKSNIILSLVFVGLLLLLLFLNFLIHFQRKKILQQEFIIYVNRKKFLFFLPVLFMLVSIIYLIASNNISFNFWNLETIASSIMEQIGLSANNKIINIFFITLTFIFLFFSIIWIFIFEKNKNFNNKNNITLLVILVLTFFNPLVGKFLILCFSSNFLLYNFIVFLAIFLVIINSAVYSFPIGKIHQKLSSLKIRGKEIRSEPKNIK